MKPWPHDLSIRRGDTKELFFRVRERVWDETTSAYIPGAYRDLTGWTVLAQYRATEDANEVLAEFAATIMDQGVTPGGVLLRLTPAQTASLTILTGVWDCQLTDPAGDVYTYIAGKVAVDKDVSRSGVA